MTTKRFFVGGVTALILVVRASEDHGFPKDWWALVIRAVIQSKEHCRDLNAVDYVLLNDSVFNVFKPCSPFQSIRLRHRIVVLVEDVGTDPWHTVRIRPEIIIITSLSPLFVFFLTFVDLLFCKLQIRNAHCWTIQ